MYVFGNKAVNMIATIRNLSLLSNLTTLNLGIF